MPSFCNDEAYGLVTHSDSSVLDPVFLVEILLNLMLVFTEALARARSMPSAGAALPFTVSLSSGSYISRPSMRRAGEAPVVTCWLAL